MITEKADASKYSSMKLPRFEVKTTSTGKFYYQLIVRNGKVLFQSPLYQSKAAALNGIESVKVNVPRADIDVS